MFKNYEGRKLRIVPKRDWGSGAWWDAATRSSRRGGFIVCDGRVNVMPGACWFPTVARAVIGIQCLQRSASSEEFTRLYREATADLPEEEWGRAMVYGGPSLGLLDPAAGIRVVTREEMKRLDGPHRLAFLASLPFVQFEGPYSDSPTTVGIGHGERLSSFPIDVPPLKNGDRVKVTWRQSDNEITAIEAVREFTPEDFDALLMH